MCRFDMDEMWQMHASLAKYSPSEAAMLKTALDSGDVDGTWATVSSIQEGFVHDRCRVHRSDAAISGALLRSAPMQFLVHQRK